MELVTAEDHPAGLREAERSGGGEDASLTLATVQYTSGLERGLCGWSECESIS